jgi:hypothetical protein
MLEELDELDELSFFFDMLLDELDELDELSFFFIASWAKATGANVSPSETTAAESPSAMRVPMVIDGFLSENVENRFREAA